MSMVLVLGGGLAGAAAAKELTASGRRTLMVESSGTLGGKVRGYGCKAADKCCNCGVCLAKGLWDAVEGNPLVDIRLNTKLVDLIGEKGSYTAALKSGGAVSRVEGITDVVVATGFKQADREGGFAEIAASGPYGRKAIITGSDIESLFKERSGTRLFENAPDRIAFIQCYGSRDEKENALYCSRVCCAYSSRAAKVIKKYYPDCEVTFFYMEMQQVRSGDWFDELKELGVNLIKCRPVKVTAGDPGGDKAGGSGGDKADGSDGKPGSPASVTFDNPGTGRRETLGFDLIVLSDGIRPGDDAARVAEICGLGQNADGFLKYVSGPDDAKRTGIYIAGCAGGPLKIEEAYAEGVAAARSILF